MASNLGAQYSSLYQQGSDQRILWEFNPGAILQEGEKTRPTHEVAFFAFSVQATDASGCLFLQCTAISPLEGKIAKTSLKWLLFFFPCFGTQNSSQVEQKFIVEPVFGLPCSEQDVARSEP